MYASQVGDFNQLPHNYSDPHLGAGYGMPQNPQYGAPQNQQHGMPQNQQYGMPQNQPHGMPQNQQHGMPQNQQYGMPQNQQYGMPQNQHYGMPQNQQHGMQNQQHGMPHIPAGLQPGAVGYNPGMGVVLNQPLTFVQPQPIEARDSNIGAAVISMFCCFTPLAIVAVVMACMSSNAFGQGKDEIGHRYGRLAAYLAGFSMLLGLILIVTLNVVRFTVGF